MLWVWNQSKVVGGGGGETGATALLSVSPVADEVINAARSPTAGKKNTDPYG